MIVSNEFCDPAGWVPGDDLYTTSGTVVRPLVQLIDDDDGGKLSRGLPSWSQVMNSEPADGLVSPHDWMRQHQRDRRERFRRLGTFMQAEARPGPVAFGYVEHDEPVERVSLGWCQCLTCERVRAGD